MTKQQDKRTYSAPAFRCVDVNMEQCIASPEGTLTDLGVNNLLDEEE